MAVCSTISLPGARVERKIFPIAKCSAFPTIEPKEIVGNQGKMSYCKDTMLLVAFGFMRAGCGAAAQCGPAEFLPRGRLTIVISSRLAEGKLHAAWSGPMMTAFPRIPLVPKDESACAVWPLRSLSFLHVLN